MPLNSVKTYVANYETQAEQYNQTFLAANLACRLPIQIRRWQLMNQEDVTCEFFKLPVDLQRVILYYLQKISLIFSLYLRISAS